MPRIRFTQNLQRHVPCPEDTVDGDTVAAVLEAYFEQNQQARGYVLDEQGVLRKHMCLFVDGRPVRDLSTAVDSSASIDVMQALSGG